MGCHISCRCELAVSDFVVEANLKRSEQYLRAASSSSRVTFAGNDA